jgi:hypothetical protein
MMMIARVRIIINICPHCWNTYLPYGLHIWSTGHSPLHGLCAGWWVLTITNATRTIG